jgi:hypothetical protein
MHCVHQVLCSTVLQTNLLRQPRSLCRSAAGAIRLLLVLSAGGAAAALQSFADSQG